MLAACSALYSNIVRMHMLTSGLVSPSHQSPHLSLLTGSSGGQCCSAARQCQPHGSACSPADNLPARDPVGCSTAARCSLNVAPAACQCQRRLPVRCQGQRWWHALCRGQPAVRAGWRLQLLQPQGLLRRHTIHRCGSRREAGCTSTAGSARSAGCAAAAGGICAAAEQAAA